MKRGSYDASAYANEKIDKEIKRLVNGVYNDIDNMKKCIEKLDFSGQKKLLDMGCGPGGTSTLIGSLNRQGTVIGIDRESRFISNAEQYIKQLDLDNVSVINGDCLKLPFKDNEFDCSFSRFVFQHLPNPQIALDEMIRVTKPGGKIGIYEWDEGLTCINPEPKYYKKYVKAEETRRRFTSGDIYLGRKLYTLFYNSGIREIDVTQIRSDIYSPGREVLLQGQLWSDKPSLEHPYVKSGLFALDELSEYYNELESIIREENSYVSFGSFFVCGTVIK